MTSASDSDVAPTFIATETMLDAARRVGPPIVRGLADCELSEMIEAAFEALPWKKRAAIEALSTLTTSPPVGEGVEVLIKQAREALDCHQMLEVDPRDILAALNATAPSSKEPKNG